MRVTLSVDHVIKIIELNKLETLTTLFRIKPTLMVHYTELKKLGGLSSVPVAGCTACMQKNIKFRKQSILTMVVITLNQAREQGNPLTDFIAAISEIEGSPITQLDIVMPVVEKQASPTINGKSIVAPRRVMPVVTPGVVTK